ncbi:universal stress protein [Desulfoluna sp.]|uniref:universal stress protein n=1 Tax=Desulfoluna sp. TaxID=2045199 RepID=UPI002610AFA6|nr:universal stress protein [Desulfoluna sp.]
MAYKKIVVAVDVNDASLTLMDTSIDLAVKEGAELAVFHCLRQSTAAEFEDRIGTFTEMDQASSHKKRLGRKDAQVMHAEAWLQGLCIHAKGKGIKVRTHVAVGIPGEDIVEFADDWGADLIVLGRTNRGVLADLLLGSASNHVVHHAQCSVLLVHTKPMSG